MVQEGINQQVHFTGLVDLRFSFSFIHYRNNIKFSPLYYMELREDVMLLFPAAQLVEQAGGLWDENDLQYESAADLSALARHIPSHQVLALSPHATQFIELRDASVVLRSRRKGYTRMFFSRQKDRDAWLSVLETVHNKRLMCASALLNLRCRRNARAFDQMPTAATGGRQKQWSGAPPPSPLPYRVVTPTAALHWVAYKCLVVNTSCGEI